MAKREEEFQSAPLTDVRGDATADQIRGLADEFQSAPLTDVRGDPLITLSRHDAGMFQSAPLTDVRGDFRATSYPSRKYTVSIRSPH